MAFDGSGAASGAAQGASAGAAFGPYGAVIGGVAGGALGGFAGKKKPKTPDYSALINSLNASGQRQRGYITGLRPQLQPLSDQFRTGTSALSGQYRGNVAGRGQQFVGDVGNAASAVGTNLSDQLKRHTLEAQPELQQGLRESLAATGGLHRGAASIAAQRQNIEAGRQIGEGQSDIALNELQGRQSALGQVFGADTDAAAKSLGIDTGALQALFNSGREDLIREAQALIDEEAGRVSSIAGLQGAALDSRYGADLAASQNRDDLIQSLLSLGGTAASTYAKKAPSYTGSNTPQVGRMRG